MTRCLGQPNLNGSTAGFLLLMKQLALLCLIGFIFCSYGIGLLDDYSISVEGPPSLDGLPELFYGDSAHPVSARREVLAFKLPERSLIYTFHLSSGHYDHLRWVGHGVSLPSTLSIRNYWGQEAATLKTPDATSADLLAPPQAPLALPAQGILSVAKWLIEKGWLWALSIILFLRFQQPIADGWRKFLTTSSDTRRPGAINGKILWLTIVSMAAAWFALGVPGAVRFDVGDDPAMEMLASGYVTGHPSEYLVFVNVLIGFVLKALYLGIPIVPWYPLLLLATVIFCLAGITRLLLQEDIPDRFCWLSLFGIVFGTYFLMHLQFTSTAYLLGLLGMFIFSQRTSRRSLVLAVILIVLGSLIRFDSFLLLLITTAAATWFLSRRPWMDKAVFFAAILILSWSGRTFDHFYYDQQDDWRTYLRRRSSLLAIKTRLPTIMSAGPKTISTCSAITGSTKIRRLSAQPSWPISTSTFLPIAAG
jgi:hypothetical protein